MSSSIFNEAEIKVTIHLFITGKDRVGLIFFFWSERRCSGGSPEQGNAMATKLVQASLFRGRILMVKDVIDVERAKR